MKKCISILLTILIFMLSIQISSVSAEGAIALSMDTKADVLKWKIGRYAGTASTEANISQDFVKIGKYSLKLNNMYTNNANTNYGLNAPVNGNTKVHMWVYCDMPESANITVNMSLFFNGDENSGFRVEKKLSQGWNLNTWSLNATQQASTLTGVSLSTFGWGADNNVTSELQAITLYLDGVFFTNGDLTTPEVTASTIADGAQLVKHDVGKVSFTVPDIKSFDASKISISPAVEYDTPVISEDTLTLNFKENLAYGETYTVSLNGGICDIFGMEFKPYTISFRVRGENENIPPSVELLTPVNGTRYIPGDEIILKATAADDPATAQHGIEYVEFYCNSELIEGSRVTEGVNDEYTFVWSGPAESLENYKITAKAVDVEGAEVVSDPVSIRVLGYKNPTVEITSPADGYEFYNSMSGVVSQEKLAVKATLGDLDGAVEEVKVYFDDEVVYTTTEIQNEFGYTFDNDLPLGEHTIKVIATDDMAMTGEDIININVIELGVSYPAMLENDLTIAKYDITGNKNALAKTEDAIIISTTANEEVEIKRTLMRNLSLSPWLAEVKLVPEDASHTIEVGITDTSSNTVSLLKFEPDGTFNDAGNTKYEAGREYVISMVVDTIKGKMSCLVDGKELKSVSYTNTYYSSNAAVYVKHSGANAKTSVKSIEFFALKEAAQLAGISVKTGSAVADNSSVPLLPDYITVDIEGGTDEATVEGNVKVYEKATGEEVAVSYKDGKVYFEEVLKSGMEYTVSVSGSVANSEGKGLAGIQTMDFTAEKAPVHIEMTEVGASLKVVAENTTGSIVNSKIIIAVFEGNKAKLPISVTDFAIGAQAETTIALPAVENGCVIEAFVVDNLNDLNPISDLIYIKK